MKKQTNTGTYQVNKIGGCYFAVFQFNDGEILFLSKPYTLERNAEKKLINHCQAAIPNQTLTN